jgi:hypothetical protein
MVYFACFASSQIGKFYMQKELEWKLIKVNNLFVSLQSAYFKQNEATILLKVVSSEN